MRILVVAAHPDDETIGVGGTINFHSKRGDDVYLCIMSEGSTAQYKDENMINVKKNTLKDIKKILGIKEIYNLELPDMKLDTLGQLTINRLLENYVREITPAVVYTHHWGDIHKDHQLTFEATMVATRPLVGHNVKRILCYEVPSSTHWLNVPMSNVFVPNVFVNITENIRTKVKALELYNYEMNKYPHPRSIKAILSLTEYRGSNMCLPYAEAFQLIRDVVS